MFKFSKSKQKAHPGETDKKSWLTRLNESLGKTKRQFGGSLVNLFQGKAKIDDQVLEELETQLLLADIGIETSELILQQLKDTIHQKHAKEPEAVLDILKSILQNILIPVTKPIEITHKPFVILVVGVNGAGKTTSIAKMANYYRQQGHSILLAAGDTFRAAAIEQLQIWGKRNDVPVIAQHSGADSASVIFDAIKSAQSKKIDIVIADTAGRLHTQSHLMDELAKIKRVMGKLDNTAPHETMLIVDASTGQNALNQATQFHKAIGLTSLSLTKLDGSAKGGIIYAIANQLKLPIRFIGIGEQMDDLKPFDAIEFSEALFGTEQNG